MGGAQRWEGNPRYILLWYLEVMAYGTAALSAHAREHRERVQGLSTCSLCLHRLSELTSSIATEIAEVGQALAAASAEAFTNEKEAKVKHA